MLCIFLHTHISTDHLKKESVLLFVHMPGCSLTHKMCSANKYKVCHFCFVVTITEKCPLFIFLIFYGLLNLSLSDVLCYGLEFYLVRTERQEEKKDTGFRTFSEYHLDALNSLLSIISLKRKMWCLWAWKNYFDPLSLVLIYVLYISGHKK